MNILFWNLHKKNLNSAIAALIKERNIDIALFSESKEEDIAELVAQLSNYGRVTMPDSDVIHAIYRKSTTCISGRIRVQSRVVLFKVNCGEPYLIVGVHLAAMKNESQRRQAQIRMINEFIREEEKGRYYKNRTIVIGDFNANPFDIELIGHDNFNAVLHAELIHRQETVEWVNVSYKRFYNPILHYLSEDTKMYGSFYGHYDDQPLYWFCLDQVLIRKPLIQSLKNMEYIKSIGGNSLLKRSGLLDENYSDHLPLLVEFDVRGKAKSYDTNTEEKYSGFTLKERLKK
ncbi:MAG: hypothetical protein J6M57_10400 [Acidaminococcaceae bacterium]|nr:hypothetical protein [Acidaminococcaceae bacterium]